MYINLLKVAIKSFQTELSAANGLISLSYASERDRQTDRQIDGKLDRHRQKDRQIEIDRQTDCQTDR